MDVSAANIALVHRIGRLVRRVDRQIERELAPLGLSRLKWALLQSVIQSEAARPSDMAAQLGVDRAVISRLIVALEREGLLKTLSRAADRRQKRLEATAAGRHAVSQGAEVIARVDQEAFAKLLPRHRVRLLQFLETVDPDPVDAAAPPLPPH